MPYVRHQTLTVSTVATFTTNAADNASAVEILNRNGAGEVYISYDGTANPANPTVAGNDFDVLTASVGESLILPEIGRTLGTMTVKLISAQATAITVRSIQ